MGVWLNLFRALLHGQELANVEAWKKGGTALAVLTSMVTALVGVAVSKGWIPEGMITPEDILAIGTGVVSLVTAILSYLSVATTKKIGARRYRSTGDGVNLPEEEEDGPPTGTGPGGAGEERQHFQHDDSLPPYDEGGLDRDLERQLRKRGLRDDQLPPQYRRRTDEGAEGKVEDDPRGGFSDVD